MTVADRFPTTAAAAFARYESVRSRLPAARYPAAAQVVADLGAVADRWDGFVLDAFGVLNIGGAPIPGAVARMADLRRRGKALCVLTNAASYPRATALGRYHALGFDFAADEVVSSRDLAAAGMAQMAPGALWGAIAAPDDDFHDLPGRVVSLLDTPRWDQVDGFLCLSSLRWTPAVQTRLLQALDRRPRPVIVANPDLVAPREGGLTVEPGAFAHDLIDRTGAPVHWFGKPFASGFIEAAARCGLPAARLAMVGDTLHTDVLGGAAAGMGTVLITGHGLFAGDDVTGYIAASGIVPDAIAATT